MSLRDDVAARIVAYRARRRLPDVPAKTYDTRGWSMVTAVCKRVEVPLPTQRLADRGERSHLDHHVHLLALAVRASCMGNRQDLKRAVIDLATAALVWAERIEARGP